MNSDPTTERLTVSVMHQLPTLFLSRVHFPVNSLGYGRRIGIWLQGCSIRCPGCVSKDTWIATSEHSTSINEVLGACSQWVNEADGITISGGEPFDQARSLLQLIVEFRKVFTGDILVYSGHAYEDLVKRHQSILNQIDLLITDPFVESAEQTLPLRGSDNQRAWPLTELGRTRYFDILQKNNTRPKLDLSVNGSTAWMAGIPKIGDMSRLRSKLQEMGFACSTTDFIGD